MNTNAAPVSGAPATTVAPDRATEAPRNCWKPWAATVSLACRDQVVPDRTNTYAAPAARLPKLWNGAPTTTVDPDRATDQPRCAPAAPWAMVSLACWDQVAPDRTNTYATPFPEFLNGAPTTAVRPEDRKSTRLNSSH